MARSSLSIQLSSSLPPNHTQQEGRYAASPEPIDAPPSPPAGTGNTRIRSAPFLTGRFSAYSPITHTSPVTTTSHYNTHVHHGSTAQYPHHIRSASQPIGAPGALSPLENPFIAETQHVAELPADFSPSDEQALRSAWTPFWLRRSIIAIFTCLFAALLVAAELVKSFADGIAESHYVGVWTFGPVVIASVLLVFWSRVEFQAAHYMPWIVLHSPGSSNAETTSKEASRTLCLDYTSMWWHVLLLRSVTYRHWPVTCATLITLLIRVQIFLSTGIFYLTMMTSYTTRLTVAAGTLHTCAALYGICFLLSLPLLYHTAAANGIAPRDPTTIGGVAAVIGNSHGLLRDLSGSGARELTSVSDRLRGSWTNYVSLEQGERIFRLKSLDSKKHSLAIPTDTATLTPSRQYHPRMLKPIAAMLALIVCILLLAGLWTFYATRGSRHHFTPDDSEDFLWTSLVTLVLVLLSTHLSCVDFCIGQLMPYIKLARREESRYLESLGLQYTNELGMWTFLKSIKFRDWPVTTAKSAVFFAWLLPIFSAGLFAFDAQEQIGNANLQATTYFDVSRDAPLLKPDLDLTKRVLLNADTVYPSNTYEDLAFPSYMIDTNENAWLASSKAFSVAVNATRAALDCQAHSFFNGTGRDLKCRPDDSDGTLGCTRDASSIGFVAKSCQNVTPAAPLNYVWGDCSDQGTITVLSCQEKMTDLQAIVSYHNNGLEMDANNAPIRVPDSDTSSYAAFAIDGVYDLLKDSPGADDAKYPGLDDFFRTLVQSHLNIPIDRLASDQRSNSVIQAIYTQHGIVRAQLLNSDSVRKHLSSDPSQRPPLIHTTYTFYSLQLIQSGAQTYALTVLLVLTMISCLLHLLVRPRETGLPKCPTSIAAQASLLADSTIWWHLPRKAAYYTDAELAHRLRKKTFRMGVLDGTGIRQRGRHFTIGIMQDVNKVRLEELEAVMARDLAQDGYWDDDREDEPRMELSEARSWRRSRDVDDDGYIHGVPSVERGDARVEKDGGSAWFVRL